MTNFIVTKEYKRFVEFCNSCKQERYIGLCCGPAGVGKSMSANHFTQWNKIEEDVKERISRELLPGDPPIIPEMKKLDAIIYTPEVFNTPVRVKNELYDLIFAFNELKDIAIHSNKTYSHKNYYHR